MMGLQILFPHAFETGSDMNGDHLPQEGSSAFLVGKTPVGEASVNKHGPQDPSLTSLQAHRSPGAFAPGGRWWLGLKDEQ